MADATASARTTDRVTLRVSRCIADESTLNLSFSFRWHSSNSPVVIQTPETPPQAGPFSFLGRKQINIRLSVVNSERRGYDLSRHDSFVNRKFTLGCSLFKTEWAGAYRAPCQAVSTRLSWLITYSFCFGRGHPMSAQYRLLLTLFLFLLAMACGRESPADPPPDSPLISISEPSLAALVTPSPISPPTPAQTPATPVPTETLLSNLPTAQPIPTQTFTPTATATPTEPPVPTLTPSRRPRRFLRLLRPQDRPLRQSPHP